MMSQICAVAGVISIFLGIIFIVSFVLWWCGEEEDVLPNGLITLFGITAIISLCVLILGWCVIGSIAILNYAFNWGW